MTWLRCMCRNCQYQPRRTRPFGETFTGSAGSRMRKKRGEKKERSSGIKSPGVKCRVLKRRPILCREIKKKKKKRLKMMCARHTKRLPLLFTRSHSSHLIRRVASCRWQVLPGLTHNCHVAAPPCMFSECRTKGNKRKKKNTTHTAAFQKIHCII